MSVKSDKRAELMRFNRYLVIDTGEGGAYRVKGIRSDAPPEMIEDFIGWYRENNRYENGRLRPREIVRKLCVISA